MSDKETLATRDDVKVETGAIPKEIDASFDRAKCELSEKDDQESKTVDEEKDSSETTIVVVEDSDSLRQKFKFLVSFLYHQVMRQHWAELCLSAGLLITILSSLFHAHYAMKTRLVQRKAPGPARFFPRNSMVTDLYDGNGLDLHRLLAMQTRRNGSSGVLFVMYYAPWCSRSMEARWHVDNLVRYFYPNAGGMESNKSSTNGPLHFIAVNCWDPNGHCRRSYKLYSYPVFLIYPGTVDGIYYNGIVSADYMFRFLENVLSPLVRLQTEDEVHEFLLDYKTGAIGYFDFNTHRRPFGYYSFYTAALKALERDPLRAAAKFAVITQSGLASRLNFTRNGQIKLFRLFNETMDFPDDRGYHSKAISIWIFENLVNPIRWVSPSLASAGKSDALHDFLTRKPTLILFAPRQPLFDYSLHYTSLTDVALRYFDCFNIGLEWMQDRSVDKAVQQLRIRQKLSQVQKRRLNEFCLRTLRDEARLLNDCCGDISLSKNDGRKSLHDYRHGNICQVCYPNARQPSFCERFFTSDDFPSTMSPATKEFLTPLISSRSCDQLVNDFLPKASVIDYCCRQGEKDGAGAERMVKQFRKQGHLSPVSPQVERKKHSTAPPNCEKLRLSRLLGYSNEEEDEKENGDGEDLWRGLACHTNRSLQFAAMDRNHYGAFARKLGLMPNNSLPVAVIVDNLKEAVYTMDGSVTAEQLGTFVVNFTYGRLSRYYRSDITSEKRSENDLTSHSSGHQCNSGSICIRTVTSKSFSSVVMDPAEDVLLFYTANWCGSCQRLYHLYQTLAHYFRSVKDKIMFAQMDVTNNDLPWQFTIDSVPALIFFPANRKSESIVFPSYAPWTLPNLVAFVVAHCQHETRLRFALSTCVSNSSTNDSQDSRCLVRNRYRTSRHLLRIERKIRRLESEIQRQFEESKWDWDHDDESVEWRVYLQRTWIDMANLRVKARALRTLLTQALRRNHFKRKVEQN